MAEKQKKKTAAPRRRLAATGNIPVKHIKRQADEAEHLIDLKIREAGLVEPISEVYNPAIITPPPSARTNYWPFKAYRRIALSFIIIVVAALGIVAYFALVRLDVMVTPKISSVKADATFTVYDRPESYNLPVGSIFGLVRASEIEYSEEYPATGSERTGAEVSGIVTIVNNYSKDQPLVATTRLLTPTNQLLRLRETVLVPAGGSISVSVYGETADPSFTLADTKLTIPGLWAGLQDKIYAVAKAGAVSYKEKKKIFITQTDLENAITEAKKSLLAKAAAEITKAYADYDQRLYKIDDSSISFSFNAKAGEEKENMTITMTATVAVVAFKTAAIEQLDDSALEAMLDSGQLLMNNSAAASTFSVLSADTTQNVAEVKLATAGQAAVVATNDLVDRSKLVGLTETQIKNYLDSLGTIASYELRFTPSFIKIAPQLVDRITVTTK